MSDTFVYVIGSRYKDDAILKIGVSNDPEKRLKTLQTSNPFKLRLLLLSKRFNKADAFKAEKMLHELMKDYRLNGEWFSFDYGSFYLRFETIFISLVGSEKDFKAKRPLKSSQIIYTKSIKTLIETRTNTKTVTKTKVEIKSARDMSKEELKSHIAMLLRLLSGEFDK